MKKYLLNYLNYINKIILENAENQDIKRLKEDHLIQIKFMQHERLVHLIVTCLFSILLFICLAIFFISNKIVFIFLIMFILALLIPYISHYYFLENNVQKMYDIYNKLSELSEKRENK